MKANEATNTFCVCTGHSHLVLFFQLHNEYDYYYYYYFVSRLMKMNSNERTNEPTNCLSISVFMDLCIGLIVRKHRYTNEFQSHFHSPQQWFTFKCNAKCCNSIEKLSKKKNTTDANQVRKREPDRIDSMGTKNEKKKLFTQNY